MKTLMLLGCGLLALSVSTSAQAQMKLSAKQQCAKPDPTYAVPVADGSGHVLMLSAQKCTWMEGKLGDERLAEETDTVFSDVKGSASHDRGYGVGNVEGGDKYFLRFEGTGTMKNNAPQDARCTWNFTGGTGKLAGLAGKGTCKGTFASDGTASFEMLGEYTIHNKTTP